MEFEFEDIYDLEDIDYFEDEFADGADEVDAVYAEEDPSDELDDVDPEEAQVSEDAAEDDREAEESDEAEEGAYEEVYEGAVYDADEETVYEDAAYDTEEDSAYEEYIEDEDEDAEEEARRAALLEEEEELAALIESKKKEYKEKYDGNLKKVGALEKDIEDLKQVDEGLMFFSPRDIAGINQNKINMLKRQQDSLLRENNYITQEIDRLDDRPENKFEGVMIPTDDIREMIGRLNYAADHLRRGKKAIVEEIRTVAAMLFEYL